MEFTPITVEKNNKIYLKRDDLFSPYPDLPINGNKVRQLKSLIENNLNHIIEDCDRNVYVGLFSSSCQGVVLSKVINSIKEDINLRIFHGIKTESVRKNKLCLNAIIQGAKIDVSARAGYDSVIQAELRKRSDTGERFFDANIGHNIDIYPEDLLFTIAEQTKNLPNLDILYVPVGSGYTFAGILIGIVKNEIPINRVIGLCVSDNSEHILNTVMTIIKKHVNLSTRIDFVNCNIGYHREVKMFLEDDIDKFELDNIYEGKAYKRMLEILNPEFKNGFWVSGNMNNIRRNVYGLREAIERKKSGCL